MAGIKYCLAGFFIFAILLTVINGNVIIKTNSGEVEATEIKSILKDEVYYSFMGIPYAEPPIGELRFMPPKPHKGWDGILKETKERKHCAQFNFPQRRIKNYGFCGDEDCLYLNIYVPKSALEQNAKLPTIVFLGNEKFRVSHNSTKDYGPDFFVKEDVIVAIINHRLGSLGFLSFADELLPGNNGLRDIILGLKWIKENIENFGGDPNRITLMGHQDGGAAVDILLHSPKAKGLYSAAIMQSGTSWNPMYFIEKTRERAIELSKVLEIEATTSSYLLKRLADIEPMKLTEVEHLSVHADESRAIQRPVLGFGPIIEHDHPDAVITEYPENKPIDIDVPVMIGYNSREGIELTEHYLEKPQYLTFADRDFLVMFPVRTNYHFKLHENVYNQMVQDIKDFYFDEGYVKISKPGEFISYLGDTWAFYPIDYTVRKYANESKSQVYYYTFDYSGELNMRKNKILSRAVNTDGTWGASLGDELCYLFVCKPIRKAYIKAMEEDEEEYKVLRNMVRLWTNFAKTGNPTPSGEEFTWKPVTKENKECLLINDELTMKTKLHEDRITYWDNFIAKYKDLAVDGVVRDEKDEL